MAIQRIHVISDSATTIQTIADATIEIDPTIQVVQHQNNRDFLEFNDVIPLWEIVVTDLIQISMPTRTIGKFVPVLHISGDSTERTRSLRPLQNRCASLENIKQQLVESIASTQKFLQLKNGIARFDKLDGREREVILMVADGIPNKAVARQLNVSVKTIEHCRRKAYTKLNVKSSAEVASLITFGKFFTVFENACLVQSSTC